MASAFSKPSSWAAKTSTWYSRMRSINPSGSALPHQRFPDKTRIDPAKPCSSNRSVRLEPPILLESEIGATSLRLYRLILGPNQAREANPMTFLSPRPRPLHHAGISAPRDCLRLPRSQMGPATLIASSREAQKGDPLARPPESITNKSHRSHSIPPEPENPADPCKSVPRLPPGNVDFRENYPLVPHSVPSTGIGPHRLPSIAIHCHPFTFTPIPPRSLRSPPDQTSLPLSAALGRSALPRATTSAGRFSPPLTFDTERRLRLSL